MLRFCLGRAGSGKSRWIYEDIRRALQEKNVEQAILLVPEQYSFESERALAQLLGQRQEIRVYSFSRLMEMIFRAFGGFSFQNLDDVGRQIFMNLAIGDCRERLEYYRRPAAYPAFQDQMLDTVSVCKNALISPEKLLDTAALFPPDSALGQKMRDVSLLYGAYEAYVAQSCLDPLDHPQRCAGLLRENLFFQNCGVWVDGFSSFSAAQLLLLGEVLGQAPQMTVALCADSLWQDPSRQENLFAPTKETAQRLIRLAREKGVEVLAPVILAGQPRYISPGLGTLEKNFYLPRPEKTAGTPSEIKVVQAANAYEEAEYTALSIRRLVREKGYRYREITLLVRQREWWPVLDAAFRRYEIPYFRDERVKIRSSPLLTLLFSALRACQRWESQDIFTLCKTQLLSLEENSLQELENYCYTYGVTGKKWLSPFTGNPDGLQEGEMTPEQLQRLERLNDTRQALIEPLALLRERIKDCDGAQITEACYQFLEQAQVPQRIEAMCQNLPEGLERERFQLLPRVWELLMDLFDRMHQALSGISMGLERYLPLLERVLDCGDLGQIPQSLDCVTMGLVDRARPSQPRAVFLLGANEGMFPQRPRENGLFSLLEKETLEVAGMELGESFSRMMEKERFQCYTAIAAPSDFLQLSYSIANLQGDQLRPSELVRQIKKIFPELPATLPEHEALEDRVETWESAFSLFCIREGEPIQASLRQLLGSSGRYASMLERLERSRMPEQLRIEHPEKARQLFGASMRLSPTRLERFYHCPFLYFCQDGLRVRPRPKAKITALETGSLVHYALEQMGRLYPGKVLAQLTDEALWREVERICAEYIRRAFAGAVEERRVEYQLKRISGNLFHLLRALGREFEQSDFSPVDFELSISPGGDVPPLVFQTPTGARVQVEGRVDRVDTMEKDGVRYLRVVDYKTGSKKFRLSDVYQGINMQMLLYLFTICQNGEERYGKVLPAGVLYLPATVSVLAGGQQEDAEGALPRTVKMNGLLLDDPVSLTGMEADLKGVFIPCKIKKDGSYDAHSSVATLEQMGRLARMLECRVRQMADHLLRGQVEAVPLSLDGETYCGYCEYRAVCTREQEDTVKEAPDLNFQQVMERIDQELEQQP